MNIARKTLIISALAASALLGTAVFQLAVQPGEHALMIKADGHPGAVPNPNDWR